MRLLVLGGTQFVGKHIVLTALARGHAVSIFTRGKTGDDLPAGVERLRGDRGGDLGALSNRTWDACIDVSGYLPRVVRNSAEALRNAVSHYAFISTVSVYADFSRAPVREDDPLIELPDPAVEEVTGETYGGLKVLCERAVTEVFGKRAALIRPDIVAGSFDPTDRFTYWPERLARGGTVLAQEVLAPGDGADPIQWIDARDLAAFTLRAVEEQLSDAYNVTGNALPFREFLERASREIGGQPTLTWVSADFLEAENVGWNELPMFVPRASDMRGLMSVDNSRAKGAGLTLHRPEDTVRDVLDWANTRGDAPRKAGLSPERERELLARWHERE